MLVRICDTLLRRFDVIHLMAVLNHRLPVAQIVGVCTIRRYALQLIRQEHAADLAHRAAHDRTSRVVVPCRQAVHVLALQPQAAQVDLAGNSSQLTLFVVAAASRRLW